MCRGKKECKVLGTNINLWSQKSPLNPPFWFKNEIELFSKAYKLALKNKIDESMEVLHTIQDDKLRDWYVEHGQLSGRFRNKILKIKTKVDSSISIDELRSPDKYRKEVFKRDCYACQYCGNKVIPKEILSKYEKMVGKNNFKSTGTNAERHGIVLAFRANADHIIPWSHGGKTNVENLITSCWSCNYGKAGFTLEELSISNPKNNKFMHKNWNGLTD